MVIFSRYEALPSSLRKRALKRGKLFMKFRMTPKDLAKKYLSSFFGEEPIENMELVLAPNLEFSGPFYKFNSSKEYIASLKENPPVDVSYELIQEYENESSCCLVYKFHKPNAEAMMAQVFEVTGNKISRIRLLFDTADFSHK